MLKAHCFCEVMGPRRSSNGRASPVLTMRDTLAGSAMVTFLLWMVNARTSFFIGRTPVWNRIGSTSRSVGSNSMLPLFLCLRQGWHAVCQRGHGVFLSLVRSWWGYKVLGFKDVPHAGHALWAEVGGSIIFVTSGRYAGQHKKLPVRCGMGLMVFMFLSCIC